MYLYATPIINQQFQSTHPVRGATWSAYVPIRYTSFQSTHPVRGATSMNVKEFFTVVYFNPRTP